MWLDSRKPSLSDLRSIRAIVFQTWSIIRSWTVVIRITLEYRRDSCSPSSVECLKAMVTDHACPDIFWFTGRKQHKYCTRIAGIVPSLPDLFEVQYGMPQGSNQVLILPIKILIHYCGWEYWQHNSHYCINKQLSVSGIFRGCPGCWSTSQASDNILLSNHYLETKTLSLTVIAS